MARNKRAPRNVEATGIMAPLTLEQVHRVLTGRNETTGLEHVRQEVSDKNAEGVMIKRCYDGGRCLHNNLGHAMLHYAGFQIQTESTKFFQVENKFILFQSTLSSTPLSKWAKVMSGKQDKERTDDLFLECIKEWFGKFEVAESRREQMKYVRHSNSLRMSKEFDGVSEFAEAVKMLFKLSNMIPDGSSYPTPDLTNKECLRAIFDAQPDEMQEKYKETNLPEPEQSKYNDLVKWFMLREVARKRRRAHRRARQRGGSDLEDDSSDSSVASFPNRRGTTFKVVRKMRKRRKTKFEIAKRRPNVPNANAQLSLNEIREMFQNVRATEKCPYHPNGQHKAADCAQNPANAGKKEFDKFRPKQRPGAAKRNGNHERRGRAEAHVAEAYAAEAHVAEVARGNAPAANVAEAHVVEESVNARQEVPANDPDDVEFFMAYNPQSRTGGFRVEDFPVTETMTWDDLDNLRDYDYFPPGKRWDPDLMSHYEFAKTNTGRQKYCTRCKCFHGVNRAILLRLWPYQGNKASKDFRLALKVTPCAALKLFWDIVRRWQHTLPEETFAAVED